jgi:DNA-binding NtrC family response regulator
LIPVLLCSRDVALHPLLSSALANEFEFTLETGEAWLERLGEEEHPRVVILDLNSPNSTTREHIDFAREMIAQHLTVLLLAADGLRPTAEELVGEGAFAYCRRPPSIRDMRALLRQAHEAAERRHQFEVVQQRIDQAGGRNDMVGTSPGMRGVHQLIDRVANIDASVLICGESGTGKELIARAIHKQGSRANKPFIAVACGAIPETLIESELFGHEKGAFTGTVGAREGFFEQAGDGTLFLDEIGELSALTQVKLLRVLQQREFNRLGSNRLVPLRARVLFATHRDLGDMVRQGRFRQDLYYRIDVMKIETPSLQERSEDIPALARHFLRRYADLFQKSMTDISPEAVTLLENHAWPGNVRELENVIQRGIIVAHGTVLRPEDLPATLQSESVPDTVDAITGGSFERQLRDYKIKLAEKAIRDNNGNKTLAARSLSISRAYLHRLIRTSEAPELDDTELEGTELVRAR